LHDRFVLNYLGTGLEKVEVSVVLSFDMYISLIYINPFMPSVPQNGTPTLTANYKIIQALMG